MSSQSAPEALTPASALSGAPIFSGLSPAIVDQIAERAAIRNFGAGETVFAHGQFDGTEILYVAAGRLRSARADRRSGATIVETVAAGGFFALALGAIPADAARFGEVTITAEADAVVLFIEAEGFRALVAQRPLLARSLLLHFAEAALGAAAGSMSEAAPERRVFAAIAALVRRDAVAALWRIDRMPKHRDLADLANVAETDAATAVAQLISAGVARRDYPGLVIEDMAQLNRLAR